MDGDSAETQLLRTNLAFYEAFAAGDIEGMDALWARRSPVACIHPGWPALHGRDDVMSSWRAILLGGGAPAIRCEQERAFVLGNTGYVTCVERIADEALVATNVFAREEGLWHVVHHQAGPLAQTVPSPPPGPVN